MRKLFVPVLLNKDTFVDGRDGVAKILHDPNRVIKAFYTKDEAITEGHQLALSDPKGKVVILEASTVIEPKKVEFTQKEYNARGELLV